MARPKKKKEEAVMTAEPIRDEQSREQSREQSGEQSREQAREQSREQSREQLKEQSREQAMENLRQNKDMDHLWEALVAFQGYPFYTMKHLEFTYCIRGYEMFVDRKGKSITRSTVEVAFQKAVELGAEATGPKKLGCFGASYLYPVFIHFGVIPKQ